ncbi:hypothetical protein P280DRAFT_300544 [Massarina eburnea CBS 473.64]|uniref:Uncharacterized protein n=1 Tax=Massarina eburnea CBS 473.64 TaxID=1395130 RepID=A0A6A6S0M6_9PLEO|nr:hypothetical protein P280DRAFT_300544 [Massarina eburnea CBS 473.64]
MLFSWARLKRLKRPERVWRQMQAPKPTPPATPRQIPQQPGAVFLSSRQEHSYTSHPRRAVARVSLLSIDSRRYQIHGYALGSPCAMLE